MRTSNQNYNQCISVSVYCNWLELDIDIAGAQFAEPRSMAWQSPHVQRGSAFGSHRDTAADRGVPAGHALRLDQLLAAAASANGCGAHRANGGPWHQHLAHFSSHQNDKPPNPPNRHLVWCSASLRCSSVASAAGLRARSCWPLVRNIQHEWDIQRGVSSWLSQGSWPLFWRCLQSTKYKKWIKWDHVNSCDHMIRPISWKSKLRQAGVTISQLRGNPWVPVHFVLDFGFCKRKLKISKTWHPGGSIYTMLAAGSFQPSTRGFNDGKGCSFVELLASEATKQKPSWFVSHAWKEPVWSFVNVLQRHKTVRQLTQHVLLGVRVC